MKQFNHWFMRTVILLSLFCAAILSTDIVMAQGQEIKNDKTKKLTLEKVDLCVEAYSELKTSASNVTETLQVPLTLGWKEESKIEFDFDEDKKLDRLIIAKKTIEGPLFSEPDATPEDMTREFDDRRFLILILSNKGKPKSFLPKGQSFPEGNNIAEVRVGMKLDKKVVNIEWSTFQSMGSWWNSNHTEKWRFEKGQLRLIGQTIKEFHRGSGEENITDKNLVTGLSIKTVTLPPEEDSKASSGPSTRTKKKGPPQWINLSDTGQCEEDIFYRKKD